MEGSQPIFDESWDVKSTVAQNDAFWADKATANAIEILKGVSSSDCAVEFALEASGVVVCRIHSQNVVVNLLDPSGLCSRRGESYLIGDVLLALCIRKEDYTYSSVTKRGFKYINILERDRIKSILDDPDVSPELQEVKIRYIPIHAGDVTKLANNKEDKPSEATVKRHLMEDIMRRVEESADALRENQNPKDSREYKIAKREYRGICVIAATLAERQLRTRNSVIMSHGEGLERVLQRVEAAHANKAVEKSTDRHKSATSMLGRHSKLRVLDEICSKYRKKPVIIVPSGAMSIVTRQNIKQFLEDNQFTYPQESMRNNGSVVTGLPMNAVEVVHTIAGRNIKFRVVENSYTAKFSTADWISVVCVVLNVKGGRWQFSGYPFESFVDMFMTMKGALFTYDTDNIPAEMNNWDVKVFRINRSHRHHDASIAKDFWNYLENFLLQPRNRRIHQTKRL
ncbi:Cdc73/Parafibromin domain containing protein [Babesia gibsoni]|uniref:Cdc73/Parafibromin domain containing protein n=1 Tax=Babesia gibsoni TaxID=33632 RepID=A0AAD8LI85_BABGI|nr:Cdc73/Parafibromin domain containing protein [Babesia gibsoni]